jgi:hypothetical protein
VHRGCLPSRESKKEENFMSETPQMPKILSEWFSLWYKEISVHPRKPLMQGNIQKHVKSFLSLWSNKN